MTTTAYPRRLHAACGQPVDGDGRSGVYSCPTCTLVVAPASTRDVYACCVSSIGRPCAHERHAVQQLEDAAPGLFVTIRAHELEPGDRIVEDTDHDGNVYEHYAYPLELDGIYHRPEDAPSYRRHRHVGVQLMYADAYAYRPADALVRIIAREVRR